MPAILCRDCCALTSDRLGPLRCQACGSPRLLAEPGPGELTIAHVDCDAFYAAIEKRDCPGLRNRPVLVGGGRRGVVATACYIARTYGIHSAMPMFKALQACPDAVVVPPDMAKYARVGREVRALMLDLTPLVEPISIDEAFLDLTGTERLHKASPALALLRFAKRVETEIGISVSVGLSYNKFLAKIASDLEKPRGFSIVGRADALDFLAERPVGAIPGIGAVTQKRLAGIGVTLVRHLREAPSERLAGVLGREAPRLADLARGLDRRRVQPERETKSISAETTFEVDLASFDDLRRVLWPLCEKVAKRLKRADLAGRSITLKLKDSEFRTRTRTRARSLAAPTQLAPRLFAATQDLLRAECDGSSFRLLGIGASHLCAATDADQGDLADLEAVRLSAREAALDRIRDRFGPGSVQRGSSFRTPQR